jgi:hypothetical protein
MKYLEKNNNDLVQVLSLVDTGAPSWGEYSLSLRRLRRAQRGGRWLTISARS